MQPAHEKKVALRNLIAGFSPSQQVRFFITFKLNPHRVRIALTRQGPWPGGDHVLRGDRQKSPGLCNREHIAWIPPPTCTCSMMDQTVHVYILHPLFLWYTSSMGPLTFSNKPPHSLTHSLTAAVFFSNLILLFIQYNEVSFHNEIFSGVNICRWLLTEHQALVDWGEDFTESFHSSSPLCPYGFNVAHLG